MDTAPHAAAVCTDVLVSAMNNNMLVGALTNTTTVLLDVMAGISGQLRANYCYMGKTHRAVTIV